MDKALGLIPGTSLITRLGNFEPIISVLGGGGKMSRIILRYTVSWRLVWATCKSVSKKKKL